MFRPPSLGRGLTHRPDDPVHIRKPCFRRRRMLGQYRNREPVVRRSRRLQGGVTHAPSFIRPRNGAECPMKQGIFAFEAIQPLDFRVHFGADGFHIVVVPPDPAVQAGDQCVGFHNRFTLVPERPVESGLGPYVTDGYRGKLFPLRAPQLDGKGGGHGIRRIRFELDHRVIRVDPQPEPGLSPPDFHGRVLDGQCLGEGSGRGRIQGYANPADFQKAAVLVPAVCLADIECEAAVRLRPGVQPDVPVPQRHRVVRAAARLVPGHGVGFDRVHPVHPALHSVWSAAAGRSFSGALQISVPPYHACGCSRFTALTTE